MRRLLFLAFLCVGAFALVAVGDAQQLHAQPEAADPSWWWGQTGWWWDPGSYVINGLWSLWAALSGFFEVLAHFLMGQFHTAYELLICAWGFAICVFFSWMWDTVGLLAESLITLMPGEDEISWDAFTPIWAIYATADLWLPLTETIVLLLMYMDWKVVITVIRFIKKWVPFMSG